MGVLIQEVVGTRVGPYWLPAFSGVGFSNNEFRWSARIRREDGLLRMVPGLGTRAVDRLADDYPILIAPGQPGLRVNQTAEEASRYSPKKADVINVETGVFETVEVRTLLERYGHEMPFVRQMVSIADHDHLRRPVGLVEFGADDLVVTFEGLFTDTPFVARMRALLQVLREKLKTPVDIEFASDGQNVYLRAVPPARRDRGRLARGDPARHPERARAVQRAPLRLERAGERRQPHRVRGSGRLRTRGAAAPARDRARRRPPESRAAEATVHPDGARPLGHHAATSASACP